jgi:hypothetical protein
MHRMLVWFFQRFHRSIVHECTQFNAIKIHDETRNTNVIAHIDLRLGGNQQQAQEDKEHQKQRGAMKREHDGCCIIDSCKK